MLGYYISNDRKWVATAICGPPLGLDGVQSMITEENIPAVFSSFYMEDIHDFKDI